MTDKIEANEELVKFAQRRLKGMGLYAGAIDGWGGPATTTALQAALSLPVTKATRVVLTPGMPLVAEALTETLPWMKEAWEVIGLHETRDNHTLSSWLASGGARLGDPKALPWCGDFVETAFARGLPNEKRPDKPFWARSWAHFGLRVEPTRGAVLVFERGPQSGHVGFAVGQNDTDFFVLGGNQGDSVSVVAIAKARLLSARWPRTFALEKVNLPRMTLDVARSLNEE